MTCNRALFYAKQRLLKSVFLLDSDAAWWRFNEDPPIGEWLSSTNRYCRQGSFDRNDQQPLCAEFGFLLRLIRPHHPPWMKAVIHNAALARVGLIN